MALSSILARRLLTDVEPEASEAATEIASLLGEAISEARDIARGLGPPGLNENSLAGALQSMAAAVKARFHAPCIFATDAADPAIVRGVQEHLYRIAQEATRNAAVHAPADRIEISLLAVAGRGLPIVRDDGVDIADEARHDRGTSLRTMGYRARLIGGSLDISRQVPQGTAVSCGFPPTLLAGAGKRLHRRRHND